MAFERVGGTRTIQVDIRLISAANRDPKHGLDEGWFRPDLLFRLNVVEIELPPLRDHREDIPALVDHFIARYARENRKNVAGISDQALKALMNYSFPGNIRELKNYIERAIIMSRGAGIAVRDLPEDVIRESGVCKEAAARPGIRSTELLSALKRINISGNGGPAKYWGNTLKCTSIDKIHEFLVKTDRNGFSRVDFTRFLSQIGGGKRNKYGTAGKYLAIMRQNQICAHNGRKANQSRFRLSEAFLAHA